MSNPGYGRLLQEWLPAVWRERDETGDLDRLLGVYGDLLDAFHATLYQRLYDSFPDQNSAGHHCQDWLLPYFAQLLDVRLVSPDEAGRRAELADAVAWRQRKGTRVGIEAIAEAVGRFEVEIQEGWKRVAIAPRIDRPLLPEAVYGEAEIAGDTTPAERARHPGLPAATLDLRYCSRAVRCEASNPAAHATTFAGQAVHWRQVNRHGLPCAPDSYQDVSYRTVDLRTPTWQRGHFHPRRVPLYYAPREGFFAANPAGIYWSSLDAWIQTASGTDVSAWSDEQIVSTVIGKAALSVQKTRWNGMTLPLVTLRGMTASPLRVRGVVELPNAAVYRYENL
ncbi:MAG: phage tail protein, partial [Pseudomonadota bacterium]